MAPLQRAEYLRQRQHPPHLTMVTADRAVPNCCSCHFSYSSSSLDCRIMSLTLRSAGEASLCGILRLRCITQHTGDEVGEH